MTVKFTNNNNKYKMCFHFIFSSMIIMLFLQKYKNEYKLLFEENKLINISVKT